MINCFWEGKYMQVWGLMKIKKTLIDKGLLKYLDGMEDYSDL